MSASSRSLGEGAQVVPYTLTGSSLRPVLSIELVRRAGEILEPTMALLDSGADSTRFPLEWASRLGIDIARDCVDKPSGTAGSKATGFSYLGHVESIVLGELVPLSATFDQDLECVHLGRRDFFSCYRILFDQCAQAFTIERHLASRAP
jgi:hypothetical protein